MQEQRVIARTLPGGVERGKAVNRPNFFAPQVATMALWPRAFAWVESMSVHLGSSCIIRYACQCWDKLLVETITPPNWFEAFTGFQLAGWPKLESDGPTQSLLEPPEKQMLNWSSRLFALMGRSKSPCGWYQEESTRWNQYTYVYIDIHMIHYISCTT